MELIEEIATAALSSNDASNLDGNLLEAMQQENFFSLLLPTSLGGKQMDYPDYIRLVQRVAVADGSTAWCVNQGSVLASLARHLPESTAKSIWHHPSVSVANGPPGKCGSKVSGSAYSLTGTWTFSSGINHAEWLIGIAPIENEGKGFRWHFFPKDQATIVDDWDVDGLKATGSFRFSVSELEVPASHVVNAGVQDDDPALYQIPMNLLFGCGFASVALGVSRAALNFAEQRLQQKIKRFDKKTMSQDLLTQDKVARAEAAWQSADAYLHQTVDLMWQSVLAHGRCKFEQKIKLRLAATHVIRQCKDVTDLAYDLCSTDSIFKSHDIHKRFQDMHVISQHLQGRPDVYNIVGKYYLGLPADSFMIS